MGDLAALYLDDSILNMADTALSVSAAVDIALFRQLFITITSISY